MKQYWGVILWVALGIWTLIPVSASKPCIAGYYAHCTFTPISTVGRKATRA